MEVRLLAPQERFEADLISTIAFHMRMEDPEKAREDSLAATVEDWGAFDADGRVAARIINNAFESWLDGNPIRIGGIGAVSTLPEYRGSGAVRELFAQILPCAYRNGEVVSTLYPFNHAFYRKFGYETVCQRNVYDFPPDALRDYRFTGKAVQWKPGDSVEPYIQLYQRFARGYNLIIRRTEERFVKKHFKGQYYKDRKFAYMLYQDGAPAAYLIFQDVRSEKQAILKAEDVAWAGPEGFRALLGFLARFSADYGRIELPLPQGLELLSVIHSPDAYAIGKKTDQNYMIRVINAQKLLAAMRKPAGARFVIRVADDLIPENDGVWAVDGTEVRRTEEAPDLSADVRALGQMAVGAASLAEAAFREDVTIHRLTPALESVFVRKPIFVADHY